MLWRKPEEFTLEEKEYLVHIGITIPSVKRLERDNPDETTYYTSYALGYYQGVEGWYYPEYHDFFEKDDWKIDLIAVMDFPRFSELG